MRTGFTGRAAYRVWQFAQAVRARWQGPDQQGLKLARRALPDNAWRLFRSMPLSDQTHALRVWAAIKSAGLDNAALAQAALMHDVAKHLGGVTLAHRVAVVLIKAFVPRAWKGLKKSPAPPKRSPGYPLWVHANHPAMSAELAADAGCLPEAVILIRRHQEHLHPDRQRSLEDRLLLALQRADDEN